MSEYLSSLDPVARGRYLKRLEVLGLKKNNDPENSGRFIDDIALMNMDNRWPRSYIINKLPRILLSAGIIIFLEAKNFKSLKVSS